MLELLSDPNAWAALLTLTALEIVLGIDNVVFISIVVSRLDRERAAVARKIGLALALIFRIALLSILTWIIGLTEPVFSIFGQGFSWRDIILLVGGLFLLAKATHEIHNEIEGHQKPSAASAQAAFSMIILQVVVIDLVFSVDSIITAIGMAEHLPVMVAAVIIAVAVMYAASGPVSDFITHHPTTKMLALAFLVMIGVALIADAFETHIPRGYVYSSMAFAALVEFFNIVAQRRREKNSRESSQDTTS